MKATLLGILISLMLFGTVARPVNSIPVSACGVLNRASGNYYLTQDIQATVSPCLDVQANNIALNGNGHSISVSGTGVNSQNHNGAIIQNLHVYASGVGSQAIRLVSSNNNQIIGVYSEATGQGGIGIYLEESAGNYISSSSAIANNYGTGFYFDSQSTGSTVFNSILQGYWFGVYFAAFSNGNLISKSQLSGDQAAAIDLSSNNVISGSVLNGVSDGIKIEDSATGNNITGSVISGAKAIETSYANGNGFQFNNITGQVWIYDYSSNSYLKNAYYLPDGTPSWRVFQMIDIDGDNYADIGHGVPVNAANEAGYIYGSASDAHPYTTVHNRRVVQ